MPHFAKPREGSCTEHFGIDTAPMSYEDSISPEWFELERDAIFRRTWLNVGRMEQLRTDGRFTQRIEVVDTTVLIVRDSDGHIHAYRSESESEPVRVEVWEGFVFVNLDDSGTTPLSDYLGKFAAGLEGYPFGEMTQVFKYRSDVGSNWKLYIDAFAEFYHAPVLHSKQYVSDESRKLMSYGFEALH